MSQKSRLCFLSVPLAALLLGGCGATVAGTSAGVDTRSPTPTALAALPACEKYVNTPPPAVAGGEPIIQAASRAALPAGVVLSPGVQVLPSTANPGMLDAIVHACSMPLTRAKLIGIGNSVASALLTDPSHAKLSTLTVQAWVQVGTDAAGEDPNTPQISLDFQAYARTSPAAPGDSAWR